ncbi:MAG: ABC transporter permease subunit [Ruminococcaceae bacterium]|nr:ABC transporter permease subunit [Oscillospiraceae bacterium]
MSNKNKNIRPPRGGQRTWGTICRWGRRAWLGGRSEWTDADAQAAVGMESPTRQLVRAFFRRPRAVVALFVLVALFAFVLIAPRFLPMNVNDTDVLGANIAPNFAMLRVPSSLAGNVKDINGFSNFTLGLDKEGKVYVWGYTKNPLSGIDLSLLPPALEGGAVQVAAGYDHAVAITPQGELVGWGNETQRQYPTDLSQIPGGHLDPARVSQLACGYQSTALVYEGKLYLWGNANAMLNMSALSEETARHTEETGVGVSQVALGSFNAVALYEDGTVASGGVLGKQSTAVSSRGGRVKNLAEYLREGRVIDVAATDNCFAFLMSDGEILVFGGGEHGESDIAAIPADDRAVKLLAGSRHFVALTEGGRTYAWGDNSGGQTEVNGRVASDVFVGAKQTYLVDAQGKLILKRGSRGYLFGTDNRGRDVFTRIAHGGKTTMTIGAVAVLVSSFIAIVIGCLSGYFGGWVDLLLMRVTEVFSAIPFLPFAMMLSYILSYYPIGETARMLLIMVILGLLSWTGLARIIRGQVLSEREKEFVLAARAMGVGERRIAFLHILPNVLSVILVSMTLDFAACLLTESSLSYLGFGVQQPRPTWGNMLGGANNSIVIQNYWWQWLFPALFLSVATISINMIGDTMRDVLDPKSSRSR